MINYSQKTLANGVRFIKAPMQTTDATTIEILVGTGARFDPADKAGISHFLEHMFFKGSKKYPSFELIGKTLDGLGAGYNATTSYEAIRFYVQTCSKDFLKGYDVLVDLFKNPLFKSEDVDKEKSVILEELKMYHDMPQALVGILNQQQTFPGSPLGRDIGGFSETVSQIKHADLIENWKDHYSPESLIVAVAGNLNGLDIDKLIEDDFGSIAKKPAARFTPFETKNFQPSLKQEARKIDQAHFVVSFPSIAKPDKRRFALNLMDIILGCGPSSRLFTEIREKRGLAYDVGSGTNSYLDTGAYYIYGGVKEEKLEEAIAVSLDEARKIASEGVSEEEIKRAKGNLRGTITRSLESSSAIADYLLGSLYWQGEIIPLDKLFNLYESVTLEEIRSIAQEIFDLKKSVITVVGPREYKLTPPQ